MTVGSDCGLTDVCAWPLHVAEWLRRVRPHWKVTVHNLGSPAMNSEAAASHSIGGGDVYIVDTAVNDIGLDPAGFSKLVRRLQSLKSNVTSTACPPAVLFMQTFRTCAGNHKDCVGHAARTSFNWETRACGGARGFGAA
jgi:hypothetical protein